MAWSVARAGGPPEGYQQHGHRSAKKHPHDAEHETSEGEPGASQGRISPERAPGNQAEYQRDHTER